MDIITKQLTSVLQKYGCYRDTNFPTYCLFIAMCGIGLIVESIFSLAHRWDDVNRRFLALEDLNVYICVNIVRTYMVFYTSDVYDVIDMANKPFYIYGDRLNEKEHLIKERVNNAQKQWTILQYVICLVRTNWWLVPLLQNIYNVFLIRVLTPDDVKLPFEFWHFTGSYVNLTVIFVLQYLYSDVMVSVPKVISLLMVSTVHRVSLDIKLLTMSVDEIDNSFKNRTDSSYEYERILKLRTDQLIKHHSDICRQFRFYNNKIGYFVMSFLQPVCCALCLVFYWLTEEDDTIPLQIKDGAQIAAMLFYAFAVNILGQQVTNEFENLRNRLYECSWVDKPVWFRKSLNVMMIMASKEYEIKPFGITTIGLRDFANLIKIAYTYFNVLRTFDSTQ